MKKYQTIQLEDYGSFSGKYFIKSVAHKISGSSAYSTSLELAAPAPTEAEKANDEISEAAEAAREEVKFAPFLETNKILDGLAKLGFEELLERLPDDIGSKFELILCLPDILDNEIRILEEKLKENPPDEERKKIEEKIGGLKILKQSFIRWLGFSGIVKPENNPDVLWVDWDWLFSEEKAKTAYEDLKANLFNYAAKEVLKEKLKKRGYFTQSDREFSFISEFPLAWRDNHHQSRNVESTLDELVQMKNGHTAALGKYIFYGMVDGRIEYKGDDTYGIYITKAVIVMLDNFDFEGEQALGFWNCELKRYMKDDWATEGTQALYNSDFSSLRDKYGNGADFFVAAPPKEVESLRGFFMMSHYEDKKYFFMFMVMAFACSLPLLACFLFMVYGLFCKCFLLYGRMGSAIFYLGIDGKGLGIFLPQMAICSLACHSKRFWLSDVCLAKRPSIYNLGKFMACFFKLYRFFFCLFLQGIEYYGSFKGLSRVLGTNTLVVQSSHSPLHIALISSLNFFLQKINFTQSLPEAA